MRRTGDGGRGAGGKNLSGVVLMLLMAMGGQTTAAAQQQAQPLTLQEAVSLAQQRGHQARAARATHSAAVYRNQAFNSRLLPQLSLTGNVPQYNRSIIPVLQPDGTTEFHPQQQTNSTLALRLSQKIPITGGDLFVSSSLASLVMSGNQSTRTWNSTPLSISLRQDILRPNVAGWDRREQNIRIERDDRAYVEAIEDVAIATTDLFFNAYVAQVGLANAVANVSVNDTLYRINTGRYQVGSIGENDLLQSELALLRSQASVDQARLDAERTMAALRLGLNMPADLPLTLAVSPALPEYVADSGRAVAEAQRNRSAVTDTELQDVQSQRQVSMARFSAGTGATLLASYGYNATAPKASLAYENLLEARQLTLSISMPLWQWGAHGEDVRAARADRDRVSALSQVTLENLSQEARFAALQLNLARRNVALLIKADSVAGRRFEVAYNRYVIGRITIDNLYIAQNEKDAALTQSAEGLRRYWLAHYRLRRATLYDFEQGRAIHALP